MKIIQKTISKQESYNAIDVIKFIMSILVVMIHVPPFGTECGDVVCSFLNYGITQCIARIAVPFFFICSGYFLFSKMTLEKIDFDIIKKYLIRMLRIYLVWTLVYMPLKVLAIINEASIWTGLLKYIRDILFVGSYTQLWYLNATIVAVICVSYLLYKKMRVWKILTIGGGALLYRIV